MDESATSRGSRLAGRRAVVGGAVGVVVAAAHTLVTAPGARAADGDPVVLGATNVAQEQTSIVRDNAGGPALHASCSTDGGAIHGENTGQDGYGVSGTCTGSSGIGALGLGGRTGVYGSGAGSDSTGVYGIGDGEGVFGTGYVTGVHGRTLTVVGTGVYGESTDVGVGVKGTSATGVGVHASAGSAGIALQVQGRATFSRSGRAVVRERSTEVTVPGVDLTADSLVLATVQQAAGGAAVRAAVPDAGSASIRILLHKAVSMDTVVGWFVVN
jgi:hypothetical protein